MLLLFKQLYWIISGIFANSHLYMRNDNGTLNVAHPISTSMDAQPSLKEMTKVAVQMLQKSENGFFLMVRAKNNYSKNFKDTITALSFIFGELARSK